MAEAEWRGRMWAYENAKARHPLTDRTILDLHKAMFDPLLDWAGCTRTKEVGPGGIELVPFWEVPWRLRELEDHFASWLLVAGEDPSIMQIATVIADTHHRFQYIHPFNDTNGRTGRVLDHFVLWSSFGLAGRSIDSRFIEHFPDEACEDEYYDGLNEADARKPARLRAYYAGRLEAVFAADSEPEKEGL